MERPEIFRIINHLEQKYPVADWAVNDIAVWPLIRIRLLGKLYGKGKKGVQNKSQISAGSLFSNKVNHYLKSITSLCSGFFEYQSLKRRFIKGVDVLFLGYVAHRQDVVGVYYNRFCDLFIEQVIDQKEKPTLIEFRSNIPQYKLPRSNESFVLAGDKAIKFFSRVLRRKNKNYNLQFEQYKEFLKEAETFFGKDAIANISIERILEGARDLDAFADFFTSLFKYSRPKAVFCVSYYSSHAQALVLSAYRCNIPSIDIQHGIQGSLHEAYGSWSNVPPNGYNLLPKYFWNWNAQAENIVNEWARNSNFHESVNGGNPWLVYWKKKGFGKLYQKSGLLNLIYNQKVVLYTLQPSFDPFPEFVKEAIKQTRKDCIWLIRVHPRQMESYQFIKDEVEKLNKCGNVELEEATKLPLPFLLSITDVHITVYSTVAIEAAAYQVPTLFIRGLGKQYFSSQLPESLAYYDIEQEEELVIRLRSAGKPDRHQTEHFNFDAFNNIINHNYINNLREA